MNHPSAVCEKAQRLEQLLQRVKTGEPFEQVRDELELCVQEKELVRLQAKYEAGGQSWEALIDGRYGHPQTAHSGLREWMYERKREDETLTAQKLSEEIAERFKVELSVGHINYLLRKAELTRPRGRPQQEQKQAVSEEGPASAVPSEQSLDNGGIFFPGSSETGDGA
jgi:hypothetical protein